MDETNWAYLSLHTHHPSPACCIPSRPLPRPLPPSHSPHIFPMMGLAFLTFRRQDIADVPGRVAMFRETTAQHFPETGAFQGRVAPLAAVCCCCLLCCPCVCTLDALLPMPVPVSSMIASLMYDFSCVFWRHRPNPQASPGVPGPEPQVQLRGNVREDAAGKPGANGHRTDYVVQRTGRNTSSAAKRGKERADSNGTNPRRSRPSLPLNIAS